MQGRHPELPVLLTIDEREELQVQASRRTDPYYVVLRAKCLLMAADGFRNVEIARTTGQDPRTISILRKDWGERRLDALKDRPRPGRPPSFSP